MTTERAENTERMSAVWQTISNSGKDLRDLYDIRIYEREGAYDIEKHGPPTEERLRNHPAVMDQTGMILRRADKPVGYVLYHIDSRGFETKPTMEIDELYIRDKERNAGVLSKLVSSLKQTGRKEGVVHVNWLADSDTMQSISTKLDDVQRYKYNNGYIIPIEKMDVSTLVEMRRGFRKKIEATKRTTPDHE